MGADVARNDEEGIVNEVKTIADHANAAKRPEAEEAEENGGFAGVSDHVINEAGEEQVSKSDTQSSDVEIRIVRTENSEKSGKEDAESRTSLVEDAVCRDELSRAISTCLDNQSDNRAESEAVHAAVESKDFERRVGVQNTAKDGSGDDNACKQGQEALAVKEAHCWCPKDIEDLFHGERPEDAEAKACNGTDVVSRVA